MFKKNVWLINFFATRQFRIFWWLIFPSKLLAKSWKSHKLLTELIDSFNFWIQFVYTATGFYELSRMLLRKKKSTKVITS